MVSSFYFSFWGLSPLTSFSEGNKSTTQKLGDATRSGGDDASNQGQSILASAQETVGNAAQSITDTFQGKK